MATLFHKDSRYDLKRVIAAAVNGPLLNISLAQLNDANDPKFMFSCAGASHEFANFRESLVIVIEQEGKYSVVYGHTWIKKYVEDGDVFPARKISTVALKNHRTSGVV